MNPYFSVIIPVYNGSKWIGTCLDSIKKASEALPSGIEIEVVCINDGSTDDSLKFLNNYCSDNGSWCRVVDRVNEGICLATNEGLRLAKGEWIALVDQDDKVSENYFSAMYQQESKADVNFFAHDRIFSGGEIVCNRLGESSYFSDGAQIADFVFELIYNRTGENLFGYSWNKFIRGSLIRDNNVQLPKIRNFMEYQDEIFTFELCHLARSVSYLPIPLYHYRIGDNNHSSSRKPDHLRRALLEASIADNDGRKMFKSAAYMSAGMASLMHAYRSCSPRVALKVTKWLKKHAEFMLPVPDPRNALAKLSRLNAAELFFRLWLHGCLSALKRLLGK